MKRGNRCEQNLDASSSSFAGPFRPSYKQSRLSVGLSKTGWLIAVLASSLGDRSATSVLLGQHPTTTAQHAQQQPSNRQLPPVHVAPTSPTTQRVSGFQPNLHVAQTQRQTQRQTQAPVLGLQDRIEQAVGKNEFNPQPKHDFNGRRQLSNAERIPMPAAVADSNRMQARSVMQSTKPDLSSVAQNSVTYPSPHTERPAYTLSQSDSTDGQSGYQARPVAYREAYSTPGPGNFSTDAEVAATSLIIDDLWADDLPVEQTGGRQPWSDQNDPQGLAEPQNLRTQSVVEWDQSQYYPEQSNLRSTQPSPHSIQSSSHPRFRQDLDDFEFGRERQFNERSDGLRSLMDDRDDDRSERLDSNDTDGLLDRPCEYYRGQLFSTNIRDIGLDISPPGIYADDSKRELVARQWTDRAGNVLATGTMVDMRRGYVILDNGQRLAYGRLGEADWIAIAKYWNLPTVCGVENRGQIERFWHPLTYTYTASSLCHKPLYFENIQLERYGHTHGPIMQPVRSVAHFFVRLATLPYHTVIHPANECEYPLGLYRPGDCAPWLKDPIPLSLGGMRRQVGVVGGWVAVLP